MGERRGASREGATGKRTRVTAAAKPDSTRTHAADAEWDEDPRETLVRPGLTLPTLPTLPSVRVPGMGKGAKNGEGGGRRTMGDGPVRDAHDADEARALAVRRGDTAVRPPAVASTSERLPVVERMDRVRRLRAAGVEYIPGRKLTRRFVPRGVRRGVARGLARLDRVEYVRRHRTLLFFLASLTVVVTTLVSATGSLAALGSWAGATWALASNAHIAPTPTPTPPPPAPDVTDAGHYVAKYGFDWPAAAQAIPGDEFDRMVFMLPFAYRATAAYDSRYGQSIEPEMLVWWTHAEGIGARINYSNCANHPPRAGTNYFSNVENCPQANFWQLGYGNQFSVIYVLKNAFRDLHGDPNDPKLVQQVGQWVLDFDAKQGTVPACGGYSCTFPAMTIDQIMAGVDQTTGVVTEDNWWAAVLSRDPAINCYMIAHALTLFNHDATRNWVGCYYAEPCWGYESNSLGDVLAAWPGLRQAAHL